MTQTGNKLIADEGMTLTNGDAFGMTIWLASGDNHSSWYEITDTEAAILKRDKEEAEAADYKAALNKLGVSFDAE